MLHRDAPQSRQHLAYLFWPDSTESQAHTNLRNLLYHLREALPEADCFLDVSSKTLWWQPDAPFSVDLDAFQEALNRAEGAKKSGDDRDLRQALQNAADTYNGDLLPSCYDDWIIPERERLSQAYIRILEELVDILEGDQEFGEAIKKAQQLLRHDPLHEATSRKLMELYALNGDTPRALRTYHTCAAALEKELGLEPSLATQETYEQLLARDLEGEKPPRITEKGTILVGREKPFKELLKTWRKLTSGPHLVIIKGEAGIGKTFLAEEFMRWTRQQGVRSLKTRSYPTEGEVAYTSLMTLLRNERGQAGLPALEEAWLVELTRLLPELKGAYPDLPDPEELSESWQRGRLFEACARAILEDKDRLVVLLDDLHWCDRETLAWLRYMMELDTKTKLLFLGGVRAENLTPENPVSSLITDLGQRGLVTEIELSSLDREATTALAASIWGDSLEDPIGELLFQETEGNPLFVVEVVRSGYLQGADDPARTSSIPPKIQAVIKTRLDALSPAARELTNLAAIVGREFDFQLLSQAADQEEEAILQGLDELWQRRVIRDQGVEGYDFSHDKFREVICQDLSPHRQTHLHLRIAQALEMLHRAQLDAISSQLGYHYQQAGKRDLAAEYYIQAGDHARRVYAWMDAIDAYRQALDNLGDKADSQLINLYQGWGNSLLKLARYEEAAEAYQKMGLAAKAGGDLRSETQAYLALGKAQDRQGEFQSALANAEKAADLAGEKGWDEESADAKLLIGQQHYRLGEAVQAEVYVQKALALHHKRKDQLGVGRCLNLLGLVQDLRGQFQEACEYKEQAIKVFEKIPGRHSKWWIGNITLNLANSANLGGEYRRAVDLYQKAWGIMEEIQDQDWELLCLFNLGGARVGLEEYQEAERDLQEVLGRTESNGWLGLSLTHYFLAEAYLGQGKIKQGEESARKALTLARESGSNDFLGSAWRVLGKVTSQKGKDLQLDQTTMPARACFQESLRIFREAGADGEQAYTLKAWGAHELKSGDKKEGEKLWAQAREIFQRLGMKAELERMERDEKDA